MVCVIESYYFQFLLIWLCGVFLNLSNGLVINSQYDTTTMYHPQYDVNDNISFTM
jgi:hypothetical protein